MKKELKIRYSPDADAWLLPLGLASLIMATKRRLE